MLATPKSSPNYPYNAHPTYAEGLPRSSYQTTDRYPRPCAQHLSELPAPLLRPQTLEFKHEHELISFHSAIFSLDA